MLVHYIFCMEEFPPPPRLVDAHIWGTSMWAGLCRHVIYDWRSCSCMGTWSAVSGEIFVHTVTHSHPIVSKSSWLDDQNFSSLNFLIVKLWYILHNTWWPAINLQLQTIFSQAQSVHL